MGNGGLKNTLVKWADFLLADRSLGKLVVTLMIIGQALSKIGDAL